MIRAEAVLREFERSQAALIADRQSLLEQLAGGCSRDFYPARLRISFRFYKLVAAENSRVFRFVGVQATRTRASNLDSSSKTTDFVTW